MHFTRIYLHHVSVFVTYTLVYGGCMRGGCSGRRQGQGGEPAGASAAAAPGGAGPDMVTDKVPKKRCCPYDFDSTRCKTVNDRVLCGFNKNMGWPPDIGMGKELSGGCRLRGGRLECGYAEPPFFNLRRPPGRDHEAEAHAEPGVVQDNDGMSDEDDTNTDVTTIKSNKLRLDITKARNCVEVGDRIICQQPTKGLTISNGGLQMYVAIFASVVSAWDYRRGAPDPAGATVMAATEATTEAPQHRLRTTTSRALVTRTQWCLPLNYDRNLCRVFDGRILCGYQMNRGRAVGSRKAVSLGNGCRLRNGRVECGYELGPFTAPRRPPPYDMVTRSDVETLFGGRRRGIRWCPD